MDWAMMTQACMTQCVYTHHTLPPPTYTHLCRRFQVRPVSLDTDGDGDECGGLGGHAAIGHRLRAQC
jgi:hypothetical protein